ncbi:hypothetical protein BITS_0044 [Bifidobacterium tsurumiense]|uniref:Uncharacterized protein n=1 Tax=Bifidobacterium tsurumiense TaxID=356829 RepID=A0A087EC83_9BIFI|nr:hypothetical protein BITS_0044 [Bifidobacterium tsurumiense]
MLESSLAEGDSSESAVEVADGEDDMVGVEDDECCEDDEEDDEPSEGEESCEAEESSGDEESCESEAEDEDAWLDCVISVKAASSSRAQSISVAAMVGTVKPELESVMVSGCANIWSTAYTF